MASLSLKQIRKTYAGAAEVIKGIDLEIRDGEFMVFVGPSGCGKSTLLRMIAGLEDISQGDLLIDGRCVNDVSPSERGVAMVFQSYALYPHMTVGENMAFALKLAGKSKEEIRFAVGRAAEILQISHLLDRKPKALSGGQRQRVAIGRAIVRQPKVFLFDEPLSNLDAALRVQTRTEIARLHGELGTTMIYVTHDQVEAMTLGQRIAVFDGGRLAQVGEPMALYDSPTNLFVAGFLGSPRMNILPVTLAVNDVRTLRMRPRGGHGDYIIARGGLGPSSMSGDDMMMGFRPDQARLSDVVSDQSGLAGRVDLVERLGDSTLVHVNCGYSAPVIVRLAGDASPLPIGSRVAVHPDLSRVRLFDSAGNACREHA